MADRRLGASPAREGGCEFLVWAPRAERVEVHVDAPGGRFVGLEAQGRGYFGGEVEGAGPGTRYLYRLDGASERPDPASRKQPLGVHGPSEVVDLRFDWDDGAWRGLPLVDYVTYELHVGTFTEAGSFDGVIEQLPRLRELGITALELMPVGQFPGERNWGYDGVLPFAVQASYGGARALQRLVQACHAEKMAAVLDVVYNHLGPEGNRLGDFGPYFTDAYRTPWGDAVSFDGPHSDEVRRYFLENALSWIEDFHFDALRLDAVHAIHDRSALPFVEELAAEAHGLGARLGRTVHVIAESDLNDPRLVRPRERGGYGLDAMWADDFHHALHALLTSERAGYYADFGRVEDLARAWRDGLTYDGRYSSFRKRRHGRPAGDLAPERFVICSQNHDQIGNRLFGERLSALCDLEGQKVAAACVLLSPHLPLLFMGEEYGELAPFQYFVSHGDPTLVQAVRKGRREEFSAFVWEGEMPDPQSPQTFARSRPDLRLRRTSPHRELERFYGELIALRKELARQPVAVRADEAHRLLAVTGGEPGQEGAFWLLISFAERDLEVRLEPPGEGAWHRRLASADGAWAGPGAALPDVLRAPVRATLPARSCALYLSR